LIPYRILSVSR